MISFKLIKMKKKWINQYLTTPEETEEDKEFKNNLGFVRLWLVLDIKKNIGKLVGKTDFNSEKQNVWQEVEASHINPRRERLKKQKEGRWKKQRGRRKEKEDEKKTAR